jgi:hypothetical protein
MNHTITDKICFQLQHLALKAAEHTITERGYWGLGLIDLHPNMQSFTSIAQAKYCIQIDSANKKIDEEWAVLGVSDDAAELHYGTDWVVFCSMHGALKDLFVSYGLDPFFEFDIEHHENFSFVLSDIKKLNIHYAYHNFHPYKNIDDLQLGDLLEQLTKLTLFSFLGK